MIAQTLKTTLIAVLIVLGFACNNGGPQFVGECKIDTDCEIVGSRCKRTAEDATGICVCRTDEACAIGEICNVEGVCQKRQGCRANSECEMNKFCDIATGDCIDRTACGTDVHCLPGTVCQNDGCVSGCNETSDCPLYSICDGAAAGVLGNCLTGQCDDKSFCEFGDFCLNGGCADATNPNFCKDCNNSAECGQDDFCLINSSYDPGRPENGGPQFCGIECAQESDCPNGYNCGGVILLTQDQCTNDNECGGGGRRCILGEGDLRGFCTCVNDQDCAFDSAPPACLGSCGGLGVTPCTMDNECITTCETACQWPQNRACTDDSQCDPLPICAPIGGGGQTLCVTDGSPCTTSLECLCSNNQCINSGRSCSVGQDCNLPCEGGGCVLGAACAPEQGLLCPDVR